MDRRRLDSARKGNGFRGDSKRIPPLRAGVGVGEGVLEQEESFKRFWQAAPKREMEQACRSLFRSLVASGTDPGAITSGMEGYARSVKGRDWQFIASPLKWLEGSRWNDEYPAEVASGADPHAWEAEAEEFVKGTRWEKA